GKAIAFVLPRIFVATDPKECCLKELHHSSKHLLARQPAQAKVLLYLYAKCRQAFGESQHVMVLSALADLAKARMVAILLAVFRISTRRLNVPVSPDADPDIGPGGWDSERLYALQRGGIAYSVAMRAEIGEALAHSAAVDAGLLVADVGER